jgi:hypothetical protein
MQGIDVQEYMNKIPRGSQMMLLIPVHNNKALEKEIITLFNEKYQQMDEYGRKYFSGDAQEMIKDISTKIGYYKLTGKQEQEQERKYEDMEKEGVKTVLRCQACATMKDVSEYNPIGDDERVRDSICSVCRDKINAGHPTKIQCVYCGKYKHTSQIIESKYICMECNDKYPSVKKKQNLFKQFIGKPN